MDAGADSARYRRGFDPQKAYLSDRGQRLEPGAADLIWRRRPIAKEEGVLL